MDGGWGVRALAGKGPAGEGGDGWIWALLVSVSFHGPEGGQNTDRDRSKGAYESKPKAREGPLPSLRRE